MIRYVSLDTGEKPYSCGHCSRCFALSRSLKTHMRVHKDEFTYIECSTQPIHLREHNYARIVDKQYKHDSSGVSSNLSPDVRRRRRVHTEEKSYSCDT